MPNSVHGASLLNYPSQVIYFGTFLLPVNHLIREKYSENWMVQHYLKVLTGVKGAQKNNNSGLVVANVITELNNTILEQATKYMTIFWACFILIILTSAGILVLSCLRFNDIKKILCKPLFINDIERNRFQSNFNSLVKVIKNKERSSHSMMKT